jgi:anti-sigma factor RsiW
MNCEKCQNLLSDLLEGTLAGGEHALLSAHLDACPACAAAREDFLSLIGAAAEAHEHLYAPADEHALWLRIRGSVEADRRALAAAAASRGFWSRLVGRRWEFTLPQLATAGAAFAVAVSFATTLGVQYLAAGRDADGVRATRFVEAADYPQAHLRPHQASLRYWQQRVELRKASWNPRMRASFDRSVSALDTTVNESLRDLQQNPHDEVAEEILNSALRDKIDLLREFGEQ